MTSVSTISSALMISRFEARAISEGETADAVDLGIAAGIGPVDMDQADVQDERRQQGNRARR